MASGLAHDFNNLLTVICGYAQVLQSKLQGDDLSSQYASIIHDAGERAAGLTAQLLAFSRKTIHAPRVLDINDLVRNLGKMLPRLIGEDVTYSTVLEPHLSPVKADPGQLEQVLINLAVNARDAMPCGGRLTIATSAVVLGGNDVRAFDQKPGAYVLIRITDTGTGIPREIQSRIFEPFFTTKEVGKGTGLGLSTVYGILQQAGGSIRVESEPGSGTTFLILLPTVPVVDTARQNQTPQPIAPRGSETILVVEDDPALLKLVRFVLEAHGYSVLTAANGTAALAAAVSQDGKIDLLLTDIVMPGLSGREIAETFRQRWPNLKILYSSGYTADTIIRYGVESEASSFLEKPFTPLALARKIRETLDSHTPQMPDDAAKVVEAVRWPFGIPRDSADSGRVSGQT